MNENLKSWLQEQMPEAKEWLRRLVGINSFTGNPPGVEAVAQLTAEMFSGVDFTGTLQPSSNPNHGPHLLLRRDHGSPPLLLVTHSDTVFPPEEEILQNFHWRESSDGRRATGPGTVDIKGGTVMIWLVLRALQKFHPDLFEEASWLVAANASEEVMSRDFAEVVSNACPDGARAVLVFEGGPRAGSEWHLVTTRKGRSEYRVTAHGVAAHAGSALDSGANAIVGLSALVTQIHALNQPDRQLTVNVAHIEGGTVLNRVPHHACVELEMRAFDPQTLLEIGRALESIAETHSKASPVKVEVACLGTSPPWPECAESLRIFSYWQAAAAESGIDLRPVSRGGLSDANYLYHLGPTLDGLGPSGGNAHCSETSADGSRSPEYVELDSFTTKALINVRALVQLLSHQE